MKRFLFLLSIVIFFTSFINAQSLESRLELENNMVLLENKQNIIPLLYLDTIRLFIVGDSLRFTSFYTATLRYTNIVKKKPNLTIYLIDTNHIYYKFNHPNIIIVFDTSLNLIDQIAGNADALLYVPRTDSLAQDYAVQLIFGAIGAQGLLKKNTKFFKKNTGIKTISGIRLKYTIPSELGLDSFFIFSQIDSIVNNAIALHAFPGWQILAAKDGKVFFYKSYGFLTYDSPIPVSMNHLYDLASITKIAASTPCLLLLYDKNLIALDKPLSKYIPWLKFSNKRNITLIDALTHQAGLKPWIPFWRYTLDKKDILKKRYFSVDSSKRFSYVVAQDLYTNKKTQKLIRKLIKESKLLPKKQYKYSDLSFYLYPELIQRLTKDDFVNCLRKNFYNPLGAWRMTFNPYEFYQRQLIVPTEWDSLFRKQLIWGYVHDEGAAMKGGISGHAGLFSNADDLAKLMQMYLNYGKYGTETFISDTSLKSWTSYQFSQLGNRRGIAFDKPLLSNPEKGTPSPLASPLSFGHSGFTGTFAWADPQNGLLFIFLSNRVYPTRKNRNLIRYNIRTNIHTTLYQAIIKTLKNEENY